MSLGLRRLAGSACLLLCLPAMAGSPAPLVYPSGPGVPENLLHIELRFATAPRGPLRPEQVQLLDEQGKPIEDAFLDLPLPSADGRRISLLLHPGRVKSGVGANLSLGRALSAGTSVTLVVGNPDGSEAVRHTWKVSEADTSPPVPAAWQIETPAAGSRMPLTVRLDAAISSGADQLIAVRGPDGKRVAGVASLEGFETMWRFTPARYWKPGLHALVTHAELEDPSGNRACGAFEEKDGSRRRCDSGAAITFEPSPGAQSRASTASPPRADSARF